MPSHTDPRDSHHDDYLALAALGEPIPADIAAHQDGCASCRGELTSLRLIAALARESAEHRESFDVHPPRSVWEGIAAELDLPSSTAAHRPDPTRTRRHRVELRHLLIAATVLVLLAAGGLGGFVLGHRQSSPRPIAVVPARLGQVPGGPNGVVGNASVHVSTNGNQLTVSTVGLPLRTGYYEVWLFDPAANNMVAVGALGRGGGGTYTLPSMVDLNAYNTVDVSAQDYTGGSVITHAQSVLRGRFTQ